MSEVVLKAILREDVGKKNVKKLRRDGKIPGVYYAHEEKSISLLFDVNELRNLKGSTSGLIDLAIGSQKPKKCIIKEVQLDPVKNVPIHLDIMGVRLKEKITIMVPVRIIGDAIGVKEENGTLVSPLHELQISCLPLDIPDFIDVEVTNLKIGDSIHVKDLKVEKIEIMNEPEAVIVAVTKVRTTGVGEEVKPAEPTEEVTKEEKVEEAS